MEQIATILSSSFHLSPLASLKMEEIMTLKEVSSKETFVLKNKPETKEYLVIEGLCRSFLLDAEGNDITLSFFMSKSAISPSLTRTKNQVSLLNLQAVNDTTLAVFDARDLLSLMETNREIENWANRILQMELSEKVNKEINFISLNAKDRLLNFREKYPQLENLSPHGHIASYLGITTVSLSRLRRDLMS